MLTEAFGCNRCQQIFVVQENGYTIEQLSTTYPYKRSWRWIGNRWSTAHSSIGESYFPVAVGIIVVLLIVWLPLALRSPGGNHHLIVLWAILAVLLAVLPAIMVWLAYRR
ncbi:MAG: hypothetical protein NVS2B14_14360 [Chamaesiphon sp.]